MSWWTNLDRQGFAAEILVRFEFNKADQKERGIHLPPKQQGKFTKGIARSVCNGDKTHCAKGHPFSPSNTIIRKDGARICKTCRNASAAQYRQKQRVA